MAYSANRTRACYADLHKTALCVARRALASSAYQSLAEDFVQDAIAVCIKRAKTCSETGALQVITAKGTVYPAREFVCLRVKRDIQSFFNPAVRATRTPAEVDVEQITCQTDPVEAIAINDAVRQLSKADQSLIAAKCAGSLEGADAKTRKALQRALTRFKSQLER